MSCRWNLFFLFLHNFLWIFYLFIFYKQGQKNSFNTKESHLDPKSIQGIYKRDPETYKERRGNKKLTNPKN